MTVKRKLVLVLFAFLMCCPTAVAAQTRIPPSGPLTTEERRAISDLTYAGLTYEDRRKLEEIGFQHDLTQSIVEKLGIGVIVALLGFFLNRAIERYKARSAFLVGYTGRHINAISNAWQLLYQWEATIRDHARRHVTIDPEERHEVVDDLMPAIDESRRRASAVRSYVDENRFWLGEDLYTRFVRYHNSLDPYLDALLMGKYEDRVQLEVAMFENKQDILSLLRVTPERLFG